jgi:YVTN family beta-propeller protein
MRLDRRPAPAGARLLLAALLAAGALSCGRGGEPAHWICVSNERSGTVTVIDGATRSTLATIRLGKRPRGIHASPDGRTLFVALSGSPIAGPPGSTPQPLPPADRSADGIGVVDLRALVLTRTFRAGVDPEQFAIAPDGSILYVANEDAATLSLVRAADGRIERVVPMGDEPEGVGVAPGGREVVATCEGYGDVFVLDAAGIPLARLVVPGRPRSVAFLPDGSRAFIPSETHGTLTRVDLRRRRADTTFALPAGSRPMGTVMAADGRTLYVTNGRAGTVSVLDLPSLRVRGNVRVGPRPWGAGLSPGGRWLYVANGPSNDVSAVDTRTLKEAARIPAGAGTWGIAVVPAPR